MHGPRNLHGTVSGRSPIASDCKLISSAVFQTLADQVADAFPTAVEEVVAGS
jgi:hypothetical protein